MYVLKYDTASMLSHTSLCHVGFCTGLALPRGLLMLLLASYVLSHC